MSGAFVRYAVLAVGSGVTAEFLLGDQYLSGGSPVGQVAELVLYVAYYGSAAVVIREVTRRRGRGWPTILLLAFAFGVVEEGLLTQSLFNPDYLGLHKTAFGYLPALGIGLPWTIFVLTLHAVWSIAAPIAVAETAFPGREPWLTKGRTVALAGLYVVTSALLAAGSMAATSFRPSAAQLVVTVLVALAAVVGAFGMRPLSPNQVDESPVSRSGLVALLVTFVCLSAFHLLHEAGPPWLAVAGMAVSLAALGAFLLVQRPPAGAVGAGAVLVYVWVGLANAAEHGAGAVAEQVVIVLLVLAALVVIARRWVRDQLEAGTVPRQDAGDPAR